MPPSRSSSSTARTSPVPAVALSSGDGWPFPGRHRRTDPQHRRWLSKRHDSDNLCLPSVGEGK
jgi:hypothetical protein